MSYVSEFFSTTKGGIVLSVFLSVTLSLITSLLLYFFLIKNQVKKLGNFNNEFSEKMIKEFSRSSMPGKINISEEKMMNLLGEMSKESKESKKKKANKI